MYSIRNARPEEYAAVGQLMVDAYSSLEGFFTQEQQPRYYEMMANVGDLTRKDGTEILISATSDNRIVGGVVYFNNMQHYGSGGTATQEKDAAGFRFLAVGTQERRSGIGKELTLACIMKARSQGKKELIIHTTHAMKDAWAMYEKIGFKRSHDLDFLQGQLQVYGFRFML
jgi:N-acetylglutamate synthase-like GNAT family acetyltransferase